MSQTSADPSTPLPRVRADDHAAVAARLIAEALAAAIGARGRATLALSGGSSAPALLAALAEHDDIDWAEVHVLQVDERVAPDGHADRNAEPLLAHLVEDGPLPRSNVHLILVADGTPEDAATTYETTVEAVTGGDPLDVVHLGLGGDGHTASLVPGDAVLDVVDADVMATSTYQGRRRVTLTYPAINRARTIVWYVPAEGRERTIHRLLDGDASIPAGRIAREAAIVVTA